MSNYSVIGTTLIIVVTTVEGHSHCIKAGSRNGSVCVVVSKEVMKKVSDFLGFWKFNLQISSLQINNDI